MRILGCRIAIAALAAAMAAGAPVARAEIVETHGAALETFSRLPNAIQTALQHPDRGLPRDLRRDYAAALDYYAAHRFEPVWYEAGRLTKTGKAVAALFGSAREWGLDPADYPVPPETVAGASAAAAAGADVSLTLAVLAYGRHAASGRMEPSSVSRSITLERSLPDPIAILSDVIDGADPVATLVAMHPQHPQFKALRAALAAEIAPRKEGFVLKIPADMTLRRGASDPRVAVLRHRLGILDDGVIANVFDARVQDAVIAFQSENGLAPDGIVGPNTLAVLNGERQVDHEAVLVANMERWRWMPRDLGDDYVFVNVPHYNVMVNRNGDTVYSGRVVVGKPRHMTPIFSDEMEHVVVNPYWNVPSSIARGEILPKLIRNPQSGYTYEITHASGARVDPYAVDWAAYSGGTLPFRFRQPPGPRNALGSIKFLFPNKHSVYLHDTPSRSLFQRIERAFSHGCVRLHEPMAFADAVFLNDPNWNSAKLKRMVGGRESWINLDRKIPVHITYFTAWADETGAVDYRRDIYGHDRRMTAALAD